MAYKRTNTVSIGMVRILKSYASFVGADFNVAARSLDFDIDQLQNEEARISAHLFDTLWQKIIVLSNDQTPGLNFGQQMTLQYPGGSLLFTLMINCSTIGDALKIFTRYHKIMADVIQPVIKLVSENGRTNKHLTTLSWETPDLLVQSHITLSEALICSFYMILKHLSQGTIIPVRVCFTHKKPKNFQNYNDFFQLPVIFSSKQNELIIHTRDLDIDILLANKELFKILETHAIKISNTIDENRIWSNKVFNVISKTLLSGEAAAGTTDISYVANILAVGTRSLQGKLKSEQTSFRILLESVRKQIALESLATKQLEICDIAFLLGYSDQSAFNHAFKRWTGKAPKAYIKGAR